MAEETERSRAQGGPNGSPSIEEMLNREVTSFVDESPPRPVNTGDIHDLLDGKLTDVMREDVVHLIASFREWNEAYGRILEDRRRSTSCRLTGMRNEERNKVEEALGNGDRSAGEE